MRILLSSISIFLFSFAQAKDLDSAYVRPYPYKVILAPYVGYSTVQIKNKNRLFQPNIPFLAGLGFSIKNTIINANLGYGIANLRSNENYGKSTIFDLQVHHFGKSFLYDIFIDNYKGFYTDNKTIELHPDLAVKQFGIEGTYLLNGDKLSSKAAFEQSEQQYKSAGSFAIGGGLYIYSLKLGNDTSFIDRSAIHNLQLGFNGGYAYSWVINRYWLLTGIATVGANFGNDPELLKNTKLAIYPTAFARGAASYNRDNWSVSFLMLIHNKSIYSAQDKSFDITTLNFQLSFVRRFEHLFKS